MSTQYSQLRKLVCLLALSFLFVACGRDQAKVNPTPTATPTATLVPTPTPTMIPTPTPKLASVPTQPPLSPPWTLSPNPLKVNSQVCSNFGNYLECTLTIAYDSKGAEGDASWNAYAAGNYGIDNGLVSVTPTKGTLKPPTSSAQVLVDVSALYCQSSNSLGYDIRVSFTSPTPQDDQFVPVDCAS